MKKEYKTSEEARKKALEYDRMRRESGIRKERNRFFQIQCGVENDAEVIEFITKLKNKSGFMKFLIREHIKREANKIKPSELLTEDEQNYLSAVIKPFRDRNVRIRKVYNNLYEFIEITFISLDGNNRDCLNLPYFEDGYLYKKLEQQRYYTLEELGL